ncbi:MAG: SdrD B-like domain-containing protein, partial [Cyanobacteria bacterium P01_F01_bin.3]
MTALFSFDGCVYDDLNGDGIILTKDASGNFTDQEEPGYGGVTVRVIDEHGNAVTFKTADGQDVDSVQTDGNGNYSIYGLDDSQKYKIQFDYSNLSNFGDLQLSPANVVAAQLGANQSEKKDSDAVSQPGAGIAETDFITVGSPESFKVNLGLVKGDDPTDPKTARIGNQVWEDANGNGRRDNGEAGIAGVSVTLTGAGADGEFGTGDDITQTQTTNSNGKYNFKNLAAGDYKVSFETPDGFEFTQQDVGSNDRRDSDADVNTGMTDVISLSAGERNNTIDAGLIKSGGDNNAPNATDDSEMTELNTAVNINVLGNDSDPDGDALSVTSIDGQAVSAGDSIDVGNGTATLLTNGQISFTPDNGFSGDETFSYHVNDGNGGEDTANVTVQVKGPANSAPNATDDSEMTEFNTAVNINVLGNDSDPDGDPLSVTSIDGQSVSVGDSIDVGNGTATLLNNGQISFDPDAGFTGNETFSYHVSDGNGGEDTANVSVQVKEAAPASLGDRVWLDANGNGLQDVGEGGVSHVDVTLTGKQKKLIPHIVISDLLLSN